MNSVQLYLNWAENWLEIQPRMSVCANKKGIHTEHVHINRRAATKRSVWILLCVML